MSALPPPSQGPLPPAPMTLPAPQGSVPAPLHAITNPFRSGEAHQVSSGLTDTSKVLPHQSIMTQSAPIVNAPASTAAPAPVFAVLGIAGAPLVPSFVDKNPPARNKLQEAAAYLIQVAANRRQATAAAREAHRVTMMTQNLDGTPRRIALNLDGTPRRIIQQAPLARSAPTAGPSSLAPAYAYSVPSVLAQPGLVSYGGPGPSLPPQQQHSGMSNQGYPSAGWNNGVPPPVMHQPGAAPIGFPQNSTFPPRPIKNLHIKTAPGAFNLDDVFSFRDAAVPGHDGAWMCSFCRHTADSTAAVRSMKYLAAGKSPNNFTAVGVSEVYEHIKTCVPIGGARQVLMKLWTRELSDSGAVSSTAVRSDPRRNRKGKAGLAAVLAKGPQQPRPTPFRKPILPRPRSELRTAAMSNEVAALGRSTLNVATEENSRREAELGGTAIYYGAKKVPVYREIDEDGDDITMDDIGSPRRRANRPKPAAITKREAASRMAAPHFDESGDDSSTTGSSRVTQRKAMPPMTAGRGKKKVVKKMISQTSSDIDLTPNFEVSVESDPQAYIFLTHRKTAAAVPTVLRPLQVSRVYSSTASRAVYRFHLDTMPGRPVDGLLTIQFVETGRPVAEQNVLLALGDGYLKVRLETGQFDWSIVGGKMRLVEQTEIDDVDA